MPEFGEGDCCLSSILQKGAQCNVRPGRYLNTHRVYCADRLFKFKHD